ncbi:hypothetical protein RRG08_062093 [Elysia crispata]|uniref:C-type lectin domain-containing protein n=1 Tax=Elysia crispata TaxID=231223 RepID=A0AAE1A1D5_9GAST|nr:hypothetical protein RRG08_062093 [Elysia crispata]
MARVSYFEIMMSTLWTWPCLILAKKPHLSGFCSGQWKESRYSGTCIKVFEDSRSWSGARRACRSHGGDLVRILNAEMNQFIYGLIKLDGGSYYWLGLHGNRRGVFRWLDEHSKANYTAWVSGEPSQWRTRTLGAEMRKDSGGLWHAYVRIYDQGYVCEKPAECQSGKYGEKCSKQCSVHCAGQHNACNHVDGSCNQGCDDGYIGRFCTEGKTFYNV